LREYYRVTNKHRTPKAQVVRKARTQARKAALKSGAKYYTGSKCVRGHSGLRFTRDGGCVECKSSHFSRLTRAQKDRQLARQRRHDQRAAKALKVLEQLGIAL
jgi:hypothetical protein